MIEVFARLSGSDIPPPEHNQVIFGKLQLLRSVSVHEFFDCFMRFFSYVSAVIIDWNHLMSICFGWNLNNICQRLGYSTVWVIPVVGIERCLAGTRSRPIVVCELCYIQEASPNYSFPDLHKPLGRLP
jgi:hypothetical protein